MADGDESGPAYRLIYRSHSVIPAADRDPVLSDIFSVARSNNKRADITGALLITDHWFAQTLEGAEEDVRALFERISEDPRHEQVTLVESGSTASRVFGRWAMAKVSHSGGADIPLHADHGAIRPAAQQPLTREQTQVLKAMRDEIGADAV